MGNFDTQMHFVGILGALQSKGIPVKGVKGENSKMNFELETQRGSIKTTLVEWPGSLVQVSCKSDYDHIMVVTIPMKGSKDAIASLVESFWKAVCRE